MEDREVAFYKRLVREHRGTPGQVGARSVQSQVARFDVLVDVLDGMLGTRLAGLCILDLGCGKGDLAAYLHHRGLLSSLRYVGVDAIEENIEDARSLGDYDFRVRRWNGQGPIVDQDVDLIVFSGTFATTTIDRRIVMYQSLLEQARVGVVGNFLTYTPGVQDWGQEMILMDPEDALRAVDRSEFRVQMRLDYLPHDFTIGAVRWAFPPLSSTGGMT
jgi:SAM-dependent methyltransferase